MSDMDIGFGTVLKGKSVDEAVEAVTAALADQGFGVLTTIDVKGTFKKKLDIDFQDYRILGACNPQLAHRALGHDLNIGLLLPCNVIVHATDAGAEVTFVDPKAMFRVVDLPELQGVADEAEERLKKAAAALT